MVGCGDGGVNPALRASARAAEGRARPRGGAQPIEVIALSRRGSRQINRRANGHEAPALGAVGRCPGRFASASGLAATASGLKWAVPFRANAMKSSVRATRRSSGRFAAASGLAANTEQVTA